MDQKRVIRWANVVAILMFTASPVAAQLRADVVASGFERPVVIVPDPSVPKTLIVAQQAGLVRVVVDGVIQPTPFLDLTTEVKFENEQGVLGVALSPDGNRVFISFIKKRNPDNGVGDLVVARFRRSRNPLVLDPSSRFDLIWPDDQPFIFQPTAVHKGGNLVFGPDGYLYIGLGDGGGVNNPLHNAQVPTRLTGKMLRLDVNVSDIDPRGYVVPPDNPFVDGQPIAALHEIWAFGLRNPWRFSFDDLGPGATGALIVGDVGESSREEINYEPAGRGGRNYGWYLREGSVPTPGLSPTTLPAYGPLTDPIADYPREVGRAVTGGFVYRGSALPPEYRGRYFVADFYGRVFSLGLTLDPGGEARVADVLEHTSELGNPSLIPTFGRGLDGELYFSSFGGGRILKIVPDVPVTLPVSPTGLTSIVNGSAVTLSWQPGSGGGPVAAYQLEVGSVPGAADLLVSQMVANGTAATGVPDGLYFVRVRALNTVGFSDPSGEITVRVGCLGAPAAPVILTSQVASGGLATLTWSAVAEASNYLIEAGSVSGASDLALITTGAALLSGVVPSGTYFARVRARNGCGASAPSQEVVVQVP